MPGSLRRRRRVAWLAGGLVLLLVLLALGAGSGLWWTLRSEPGSAWLLARVPGLQISGGKGRLWGDYDAERVELALAGGGRLVMTGVGWRGLHVARAPWAAYRARLAMNELHAQRVEIVLPSGGKGEPRRPPASLRLPLALDIAALRVDELHAGPLGERALRDLHAHIQLDAERGTLHRIDDLSFAWDRLQASGAARIATDAPFTLDARLAVGQAAADSGLAWRGEMTLNGALAQPSLHATLHAQPTASRPEQSLQLRASLRPFEAWPLGELQARTQALDLSALHSAAPVTSLSGQAVAQTSGVHQPARLEVTLANADAGRWNEGRLPVRALDAEVRARPDDPRTLQLSAFAVELGTREQRAGSVRGLGHWTPQRWTLDAKLDAVQPALLDARAPSMALSGPLAAIGNGFDGPLDAAELSVKAELGGQFVQRGSARALELALDAGGTLRRIEVRQARAQTGAAHASFNGVASHAGADAPWRIKGNATLSDFDPAAWWPGRDDSPLRKRANKLNAKADLDLALPLSPGAGSVWDRLGALRGRADIALANSVLAGVALAGEARLRSADAATTTIDAQLDAGRNHFRAAGRFARQGVDDRWDVTIDAPAVDALAPLWRLGPASPGEAALGGALSADAHIEGRWPRIVTRGELRARDLQVGQTRVQSAQGRWQIDTRSNAAVDVQATLAQLAFSQTVFKGTPPIASAQLRLQGSMQAHTLELRADTKAVPPAWADALQPAPPAAASPGAAGAPPRTVALLSMQGSAVESTTAAKTASRWSGWRGTLRQLELRSTDPRAVPWLLTRDVGLDVQWSSGPARLVVQPGRATIVGAALRWSRIAWQAASAQQAAQLDAQAELEPLAVAPLLARFQPHFGWGGDLAVVGHLNVRSAPTFTADVVLERQRGDLSVTDETGNTQALGLSDLRVGLDAHDGLWSFTQGLAGKTLGVAAGAVVAHTSAHAVWPAPDSPIQGVLELDVANLGTWGPWLPAGWRLTGALHTSASIGGRFGAPQYTGQMRGSALGVRNFLLGVNVSDGDVAIALQGDSARIERFSARAGSGRVELTGNATLGEAPKAALTLQAERFQLLGRVDRRIVTTGRAQLQLDRQTLALDGRFHIDEGLIDFTRSDAPRLSEDVHVVRGGADNGTQAEANANPAPGHDVKLDVQVDLGDALRLRGRGLDTKLAGELHITSPDNHLALAGTVRAVDGTYAAYGQKLTIERGLITFNGAAENPRLDIEAVRPNTDVRVGVLVSGTALTPRVRLFSEPEMAEIDKLSWLVLGRANEGLGRTDTALLQRAALALLAGEGEGMSDQFTKAIGLDEVALRQTEGEVRETVVSLGKQLSRRWYVGYERSLNATAGTWQLIYRIAQRFTLRAQTGEDSSLDVIWTWRWQ